MTLQGFSGLRKALIVVCFVMSFGVLNANAAASAVDSLLSVVPETQETLSSQPDTLFTRNAEESVRVFFRFDNAVVRTDYLDNAESFSKIDSLVVNDFLGEDGKVTVASFSSPEGNYEYNRNLSIRRAEAMGKWLSGHYPVLNGRIELNPGIEAWDDLRAAVETDTRISEPSRTRMLEIMDGDINPDAMEASLRKVAEYRSLYGDWFRRFRYAEVTFHGRSNENACCDSVCIGELVDDTINKIEVDTVSTFEILYATNKSDVRKDFKDNAEVLDELSEVLATDDEIHVIRITGAASPEASTAINERKACSRAESLRKWILERRPDLADRLTLLSAGEAWEDFRDAVVADSNIDDDFRSKVLAIIDSKDSQDKKEASLKALKEYKDIYERYFPGLRYGRVEIISKRYISSSKPYVDTLPVKPEIDTIPVKPQIDTIPELPDTTATDTTVTGESIYVLEPIFAASTNALYDVLATPNFAIEVPVGKKISAYAEYTFPWWLSPKNDWAYEMLKWDIGARYWLGADNTVLEDAFRGHFVGIDLSAGYYDFEPRHKGYQGEFQIASLEYGYAWKFSDRWRLDAVIGAGWLGTHYRYYEADPTDRHLIYQHHGETSYFGPTKLGVTFKYIFTTKKEVKR